MVQRVIATDDCIAAVKALKAREGDLLFHQSGGCCDGSTPMCFTTKEFLVGPNDILLGDIAGVPFYITESQYEYWKHTQLIIDLHFGSNETFSLTAPDGRSFLTRSRLFTDEEWAELVAEAPVGLTAD